MHSGKAINKCSHVLVRKKADTSSRPSRRRRGEAAHPPGDQSGGSRGCPCDRDTVPGLPGCEGQVLSGVVPPPTQEGGMERNGLGRMDAGSGWVSISPRLQVSGKGSKMHSDFTPSPPEGKQFPGQRDTLENRAAVLSR